MTKAFYLIAFLFFIAACNNASHETTASTGCNELKARMEIEKVLRRTRDCNQRKDIDCFMEAFDSTFILESNEAADKGRTISKDSIRKDILRDWSIISKIYEVNRWIDSFQLLSPDSAIAYTDQFYHRTFIKPDNLPGEDDVVTTQKHMETWIRRSNGWKQLGVKELGGAIYVNGKPYTP